MSTQVHNGFHAKDELYFKRANNGNVLIILGTSVVELDPDTWASAVASVSIHGDTNAAFTRALDLYNGED